MTCLIELNLFYIIIEIFNINNLVTSIIPELFWFVKNVTFDNSTYNVMAVTDTFCDLKHNYFLFVIITSTSDGIQPFLKQVGPLTSCDRLKISQKSFKVALLSELSMSKFRSPNNNICS